MQKHGTPYERFALSLGVIAFVYVDVLRTWVPRGLHLLVGAVLVALAAYLLLSGVYRLLKRDPGVSTWRMPRRSPRLDAIADRRFCRPVCWFTYDNRLKRKQASIAKFMRDFIVDASSAVMMTHDISWTQEGDDAYSRLVELAKQGKLTIVSSGWNGRVIPDDCTVAKLRDLGALTYVYAKRSEIRLTVKFSGGSEVVAMAKKSQRVHRIFVVDDTTSLDFSLAKALVSSLQRDARMQNANAKAIAG